MSTIEEAREQARVVKESVDARLSAIRLGKSIMRASDKDILALRQAQDAHAFFIAHPAPTPRPWEHAKPGDVWVLTVDGAEYAWGVGSGVDRGRFIYAGGETNLPKDDPDITAGYPLWVDGKAVNGQEVGA